MKSKCLRNVSLSSLAYTAKYELVLKKLAAINKQTNKKPNKQQQKSLIQLLMC